MSAIAPAEMAKFLTPTGTLVCTLTSNGYKFYTLNLVRQLQELRVPWRLAIFCTDAPAYTFFRREGIPCIRLGGAPAALDAGPAMATFGSRQFQLMNRRKLDMLAGLATASGSSGSSGSTPELKRVVYMDGDIAVYRDFVPDIEARLDAVPDVVHMQCDEAVRVDCSGTACPQHCTGFFAWTCAGVPAMREVLDLRSAGAEAVWREKPEDQPFVNRRLAEKGVPALSLPRTLYPNGAYASLYGGEGAATLKKSTMLLHYNYLVGESKKAKMKRNGDWIIPY